MANQRTPTPKARAKELAKQFRRHRRASELSQEKLAANIGVTTPTISNLETNRHSMRVDVFIAALNQVGKTLTIVDVQ